MITLPAASMPWTWKTDFAMSRPIVVIACMFGSSESWGPQQPPHPWHSCAGGGAVHSINCGLMHRGKSLAIESPRWHDSNLIQVGGYFTCNFRVSGEVPVELTLRESVH